LVNSASRDAFRIPRVSIDGLSVELLRWPLPVAPHSLIADECERLGVASLAIDEDSALHVARIVW
jgi:hypothetical protein